MLTSISNISAEIPIFWTTAAVEEYEADTSVNLTLSRILGVDGEDATIPLQSVVAYTIPGMCRPGIYRPGMYSKLRIC